MLVRCSGRSLDPSPAKARPPARWPATSSPPKRSTRYYTGSASLRDRHVAAEVIEADDATWTHLFDRRGSLLRSTDPLGRSTTHEYDGIGRLLRTTYPEGNAEERAYDVRSNVLTVRQKPKPASTLADIVTITTYGGGGFCRRIRWGMRMI